MAIGDKYPVLMEKDKGAANGVASLDAAGKVPAEQLPDMTITESDPTVPDWAKEPTKPTYTAAEVGALPDTTTIPSKTSDLANDSGFITDESDPTVPAWAKAASKPAYTATEVGAATPDDVEAAKPKTYTATISTTWTEDSDTGAKTQNVAIAGVTEAQTAKVDTAYTGDGSSDSYAAYVEQQNQFLDYITNGFAETYDGGIKFVIFGDANTVAIPIVVEVV